MSKQSMDERSDIYTPTIVDERSDIYTPSVASDPPGAAYEPHYQPSAGLYPPGAAYHHPAGLSMHPPYYHPAGLPPSMHYMQQAGMTLPSGHIINAKNTLHEHTSEGSHPSDPTAGMGYASYPSDDAPLDHHTIPHPGKSDVDSMLTATPVFAPIVHAPIATAEFVHDTPIQPWEVSAAPPTDTPHEPVASNANDATDPPAPTASPNLLADVSCLDLLRAKLQKWRPAVQAPSKRVQIGMVACLVMVIVVVVVAVVTQLGSTTGRPSAPKTRATQLTEYINSITLSGRTLTVASNIATASPEQLALQWLIEVDALPLSPTIPAEAFRLGQRYALQTLYVGRNASIPFLGSTGGECEWTGITCQAMELNDIGSVSVVTAIDWSEFYWTGQMVYDLGLLSHLERFDVQYNQLTGTLPSSVGFWTNLEYFAVFYNQLTGSLPDSIGFWTNLEYFYVTNNQLTGSLPESIGSWTSLTFADFDSNNFIGSVPIGLCSAKNLTRIAVDCDELECSCNKCYSCN